MSGYNYPRNVVKGLLSVSFGLLIIYTIKILATYLKRRSLSVANGCRSPPKSSYTHSISNDFLSALKRQYGTHGNTFQTGSLFHKTIHTIHPSNLKAIYSTNFTHYGVSPFRLPASEPAIGRNVFTTDGEYWKRSRTEVMSIFTRANVCNLSGFGRHFGEFVGRLPKDGERFDAMPLIEELIQLSTLDQGFTNSALEFIFGISPSEQSEEAEKEKAEFMAAFDICLKGIGKRSLLGRLRWFVRDTEFDKACATVRSFTDKHILKAKSKLTGTKSDQYIFLNELAKGDFKHDFIRSNLLGVFAAGHESIAILVINILFLVSRRPDLWEKLREEALAVRDQPVTFEVLKGLKYLHFVISESTTLIFNPFPFHRRTSPFGTDADSFIPERWSDPKLHKAWNFLPFGGGPRICPGQQKALTEAAFVIFELVRRYRECRSEDEREWRGAFRLTVRNGNGTWISFVKG
ncbi:cytochrome P450 [Halenospora varia]|nr:cytochrome P450 [Halenospora varia]